MDVITLAVAKKFTKDSLKGAGALKGAPCTVKSTSYDADGNSIVVLEWSLTDGSKKTSTVTIKKGIDGKDGKDGKDGEQGETGVSIVGAHFNSNGKIVFELSDGSETAPISLPSASVDISPDSGNVIEQRGNGIFVPETDTSNFVEKEANKSLISDEDKAQIALNKSLIETLNGDESVVGSVAKQIAEALGKLNSLSKEIVDAVPSVADAKDNVIYLLKGEGTTYEMYSVVSLPDGSKNMASLGSTEIDLDGYLTVTKAQELYLALADVDKDTLAKLGTVTEGEVIYLTFNGSKILTLSQIESIVYKKSEVDVLLDAKLDKSAVVKSLDSTKTDDEIPSAKCVFDELEGKINSEQGSVNAGKALVINEEGNVVPGDAGSSAILTTEDKIGDIDKSKLPDGQMVVTPDEDSIIDDSTASGNKTWSSEKINAKLGEKADKSYLGRYVFETGIVSRLLYIGKIYSIGNQQGFTNIEVRGGRADGNFGHGYIHININGYVVANLEHPISNMTFFVTKEGNEANLYCNMDTYCTLVVDVANGSKCEVIGEFVDSSSGTIYWNNDWQELATMDKVVKYPDWSNQQKINQTEITVDQDVYIELNQIISSPSEGLKINGKVVSVSDTENGLYSIKFNGYVKKGSVVSHPHLNNANIVKVFPLV